MKNASIPNTNAAPENPLPSDTADCLPAIPRIDNLFSLPIEFMKLLDKIAIGVVILDRDRKIVGMNQILRTLTGLGEASCAGIACANILRSNICLQNCPVLSFNDQAGPKCIEGNLISRDRQMVPIRITSAPLKNIQGEVVGFVESVEDIRLFQRLDKKKSEAYHFNNIVGRSMEMEKIFQILPSIAQSDSSVLITGETGTGKDMLAEAIHQASGKAKGLFVKINCGALPETLLESELFGHRKGAFTGAVENKPGRIQLANNGTLYLTEIGDLPLSLQIKLLTFLDDKVVFPLGSVKGFTADVRIIAATHRNLEQRVLDGRFRKDLLFRLNVIRLHLPPLRERHGDTQLLLDHFLNTISEQIGKKNCVLSPKALKILLYYNYPGNIRELKNIIEYAVNISDDRQIKPRHLPSYLMAADALTQPIGPTASPARPILTPGASSLPQSQRPQSWPDVEKQIILEALVKEGGRKNKTAIALGWARSTLWRKMKQYGID
jgi:two-component system response regulator AtoC